MRNISAVQRPTPRTEDSRATTSSSAMAGRSAAGTVPSVSLVARSRMAAAFAPLSPALRRSSAGIASAADGVGASPPKSASNRPWIAMAARPASCWKTMARAIAVKTSRPGGRGVYGPAARTTPAKAGSMRTRRAPTDPLVRRRRDGSGGTASPGVAGSAVTRGG